MRGCGGDPIPRQIEDFAIDLDRLSFDDNEYSVIQNTWLEYRKFTAIQLSAICNQRATPWRRHRAIPERIGMYPKDRPPDTNFGETVKVFLPQVNPDILPNRLIAATYRSKLKAAGLLPSQS